MATYTSTERNITARGLVGQEKPELTLATLSRPNTTNRVLAMTVKNNEIQILTCKDAHRITGQLYQQGGLLVRAASVNYWQRSRTEQYPYAASLSQLVIG